MASNQFVYFMDGVSKTYPGGKKVFENIRLNFLARCENRCRRCERYG